MSDLKLGGPFSNHAVLQRDRENAIWGRDLPGQRISISIENNKTSIEPRSTIASSDGVWLMRLPKLAAGGPYRIRIAGSNEVTLSDVWAGDVWLATGQSNMELKLAETTDAPAAIALARFGAIRVLKVPRRAARTSDDSFEANWTVVAPETAAELSAVGFFFARELHQHLGIPVGIIEATWGGTTVESWMSLEALRPVAPELPEELADLALASTQIERIREEYLQRVKAWEQSSLPVDPGNLGLLDGWAGEDFDDTDWKSMDLPTFWQSVGMKFNGIVWFRKEVDLPKSWVGKPLLLCLGAIDDFDQTYFNGVLIGEHPDGTPDAHSMRREYHVSGGLVRPGRNVIAVRVFDHGGNGGFVGPKSAMSLSKAEGSTRIIPLGGVWKFAVELEIPLVSMQVFRTYPPPPRVLAEHFAPAALFHGMLAPLLPYGIRGFLWYQGESNTEQHGQYRLRLLALIRDWRTRFGQGTLPFLLVQLAGFRANETWPYLREAQAQTCHEPQVFMASALDVGEPDDIHPRNKLTVGQRLARLALSEVYGVEDVLCHGPELQQISIEGARVIVSYRYASGLRTRDGSHHVKGFELAGKDGQFCAADAAIDGERVVVACAHIEWPVAVRYAWQDYPEVNLVNGVDLPALPFRSDGAGAR
ncbi:MAG TPA: sialate O-acetylesterase [Polyangiaceae bacterium]